MNGAELGLSVPGEGWIKEWGQVLGWQLRTARSKRSLHLILFSAFSTRYPSDDIKKPSFTDYTPDQRT
jgi:hypothetical protein